MTVALESTSTGRAGRIGKWAVGLAVAAVVVAGAGYAIYAGSRPQASVVASAASRLQTITPTDLIVSVAKNGELSAIDNIELICRVEGRTTITEIVKEGSFVKKGDVVVELDSSEIRQRIEDATIELERAQLALTNAQSALDIQIANNAAELEGALVALELDELELKKYVEGTFPQQRATAQTRQETAQINLQNKLDELSQTKVLFARGFVTAAEVKKAELAVTDARNELAEAQTAYRVLTEYTNRAELATRRNAVTQSKNKLDRVKRNNEAQLNQRQADVASARQQVEIRQRRLEFLREQLAACTITAPADGMVVYVNNRDSQSSIQQGAEVRERQAIVRLPDTSSMKAIVRLNEVNVTRVKPGLPAQLKIVGVPEPVQAEVEKVSIVADSGSRWWNPDVKEYPVELKLHHTPPNLKPGISCEVEIFVNRIENATAVPVAALYSVGPERFVFVPKGDQFEPRRVKVGETTTTHAQILEGVSKGEQVLILEPGEGKRLLELAGITVSIPSDRPRGEFPGRPNTAGQRPADMNQPAGAEPINGERPASNAQRQRPGGPTGNGTGPMSQATPAAPADGQTAPTPAATDAADANATPTAANAAPVDAKPAAETPVDTKN